LNNCKRVKTDPQWQNYEAHDAATTPLSDRATVPTLSHSAPISRAWLSRGPTGCSACRSARGHGPGRSRQQLSSD